MTRAPTTIRFTRAQLRALAAIGRRLGPEIPRIFPDHRSLRAARRAFDAIDDQLCGVGRDSIDLDLEHFADLFAELRNLDMADCLRSRVRDLLAVLILWRAAEGLGGDARAAELLAVELIDDLEWRADVLDLLTDRNVPITLPGEA